MCDAIVGFKTAKRSLINSLKLNCLSKSFPEIFTLGDSQEVRVHVRLHCTTAGGVLITNFFHGVTAPFMVIVNHKIVFSVIIALLMVNKFIIIYQINGMIVATLSHDQMIDILRKPGSVSAVIVPPFQSGKPRK